MITDYHMHLRSEDNELAHTPEAAERFVRVARDRGVDEIGFTEHVYCFRQTEAFWEIPYQVDRCSYDLDAYVDAVLEAKRRGLPVKLGLEVDWVPGRADELNEVLQPYPWDYLLCSLHYVDGLGIDARPSLVDELGTGSAWDRYFEELAAAARSGFFDVLAHPDLVKFFGDRPDEAREHELHAALVECLSGTGVCLEVSTAGRHKPHGGLYPVGHLLALGRKHEIPITLASDAHAPQNVGRDIGLAVEHAQAAGYGTVTLFDGRQGRQEPLG